MKKLNLYFALLSFVVGSLFSISSLARENGFTGTVKQVAPVFQSVSENSRKMGHLKKGARVHFEHTENENFYLLRTKTGKIGFVESRFIKPTTEASKRALASSSSSNFLPGRMSFDLGVSAGSVEDTSYTELNFGLNWFFAEWFAWRNSVFYRIVEGDDYYGLDTSGRFYHFLRWGENSGATIFGGPGFRFASRGDDLPFAEAGLVLKLGGFSIGGGAKTFMPDLVSSEIDSDTQYFIILSGSGSIF